MRCRFLSQFLTHMAQGELVIDQEILSIEQKHRCTEGRWISGTKRGKIKELNLQLERAT